MNAYVADRPPQRTDASERFNRHASPPSADRYVAGASTPGGPRRRTQTDLTMPASSPALPVSLRAKFQELTALGWGWDGDAAEPLTKAAIEHARALTLALLGARPMSLREPRVVPTFDGRLQLEWHLPDRSLEAEFTGVGWTVLGVELPAGLPARRHSAEVAVEDYLSVVPFYDWFIQRGAGRAAWPSR